MTDEASRTARPWWRSAVFYEIYIRSFADGNGDGVGDLIGIRSRLPYLAELGVDAIWITPFYPSPMADGGYDVADYRGVDPLFGTLADFDRLVQDAHDLDIRVMIDIVPNHTSARHPWFQAALAAGPGSRERERYIFRPGRGPGGTLPPNDWKSVFGGPAWTRVTEPDGRPGEWYLHLFDRSQPDLNWRDPEVRREFESILRFWLDRGVDGFRIDVAHGLIKKPHLPDAGPVQHIEEDVDTDLPYWDEDEVHDIYREWRKILDSYPGDRMAIAEAWVTKPDRLALYLRRDELHQAFNFGYLLAPWRADRLRAEIDKSLAATAQVDATTTWVLSNHDVVRHVTRYGADDLALGERRARAALLLTLALPGSVYLYQGEELGLPEVTDLPVEVLQDPIWERSGHTRRGRDGCRVPIPWAGSVPPFGFGPDGSTRSWLPIPVSWRDRTVEKQLKDPSSMLALYRTALRVRRTQPALGDGPLRWLDSPPNTLVFARDPGFVCTVNLGRDEVKLPEYGQLVLASAPVPQHDDEVWLPPDTAAWWRAR
ncbi:Alpha-glucosidase [Carbonactinospora thermoautotrophica]|uniref:Alpha-glucosidase n=1 Tax=Carbonactinospora thermoautotrophica TaxID=1469144 RepID=A0A132MW65_9ACTN|nr:glycoside hydrolase family 13 protein [Carbonactinospora thermoautotrophica]KWX02054.1 Alpha-glucosidase [Carbonactinospora thermoautotrophica]